MNKLERIDIVRLLGLNTQEHVLISSEDDVTQNSSWLAAVDKYTVRTFSRTPRHVTEPSFPIIDAREFLERHLRQLLRDGWNVIVARGIDPQYAEFAGAIMRDGWQTVVEIAYGIPYGRPVTVRRVSHEGLIDRAFECHGAGCYVGDEKVDSALAQVYAVERRFPAIEGLRHVIYEFSYYAIPVGWKRENIIFWEITGVNRMEPDLDPEMIMKALEAASKP